ncbi:MAG TPA: glycoside hydrolase family 15 protein [Candidatus Thermoplasmatota archaeon]|nr:glycoside hydrolase family 15 protein [Candidatus Thermoplasmatota archaeon]
MPRDVPLGNGRLLVNFDAFHRLRDVCWPHTGSENHTHGHVSHLLLGSENRAVPLGPGWRVESAYEPGALVAKTTVRHARLAIEATILETVAPGADVFARRVRLANLAPRDRRLSAFAHHDLHVGGVDHENTVYWDPDAEAMLHYREDRWFAAGVSLALPQYACGRREWPGFESAWRDAEDARLSNNPVAHGCADGVVGGALRVPADGGARTIDFWLAAASTREDALRLHALARRRGALPFLAAARRAGRALLARADDAPRHLPADVRRLYDRSLLVMTTNLDHAGGILAANDADIRAFNGDTYAHVWPRDAAFVANALDEAGLHAESARYLRFVLPLVNDEGWLEHKYTPAGRIASTWHPRVLDGKPALAIQEDETALTLWALAEHGRLARDATLRREALPKVRAMARFLAGWVDDEGLSRPSWDLWEERHGVHAFTVATAIGGLRAAAALLKETRWAREAARLSDALRERLYDEETRTIARRLAPEGLDTTPDASLVALLLFDVLPSDDPLLARTLERAFDATRVKTRVGGVARYVGDAYHRDRRSPASLPGNPWFICTLWRARWLAATGRVDEAIGHLRWCVDRALPSGVMAEQLHPTTGAPLSVAPLTWSHATYVTTARAVARARSRGQRPRRS